MNIPDLTTRFPDGYRLEEERNKEHDILIFNGGLDNETDCKAYPFTDCNTCKYKVECLGGQHE